MIVALLELRQTIHEHERLYLFTIFVMLTWMVWMVKVVLSRRYRPWTGAVRDHDDRRHPGGRRADRPVPRRAARIIEQRPSQIVVVINGNATRSRGGLRRVRPPSNGSGRRSRASATRSSVGVERGLGRDRAARRQRHHLDAGHAAGTDQAVRRPEASAASPPASASSIPQRYFLTRWADWLENSRALYSMPAQSVLGTIGCLPGPHDRLPPLGARRGDARLHDRRSSSACSWRSPTTGR